MSNNAEQYTVKTLEEVKEQVAKKNGFNDWVDLQQTWLERVGRKLVVHENYIDHVAKLWNAELIKENERLKGTLGVEGVKQLLEARKENKLYREALTKAQEDFCWMLNNREFLNEVSFQYIEDMLSKFQPKKDESTKI